MPPRLTIPMFGERKVFIASINGGEYHELKEVLNGSTTLEASDDDTPAPEIMTEGGYAIRATIKKLPFDIRDLLKQTRILLCFKVGKRRKTTYKTIRHDCAKRNGRR